MLIASPVLAQYYGTPAQNTPMYANEPTARAQPQPGDPRIVPSYQLGDNQQAGGPASNLNPGSAPVVAAPGYATSAPAYEGELATGSIAPRGGMMAEPMDNEIPDYQRGSNHTAGGPANELNTRY